MLIATITEDLTFNNLPRIDLQIQSYWWEPRLVNPSQAEINACPETFRCYLCGESHPAIKLGGRLADKWVCRDCFPWVDERIVRCLVHFDETHYKTGIPTKPAKYQEPPVEHTDWELDQWWAARQAGEHLPARALQKIQETLAAMRRQKQFTGEPMDPEWKVDRLIAEYERR